MRELPVDVATAEAILFASSLGFNPLTTLLGSQQAIHVTTAQWNYLTDKQFFPAMIQLPFPTGW